jgi:hypothetical protein
VRRTVDERLVGDLGPIVWRGQSLLDEPEDREERIQGVVAVEAGRIVDGQWPTGLACQLQDRRRADRALDVAVQLDLGNQVEGITNQVVRQGCIPPDILWLDRRGAKGPLGSVSARVATALRLQISPQHERQFEVQDGEEVTGSQEPRQGNEDEQGTKGAEDCRQLALGDHR